VPAKASAQQSTGMSGVPKPPLLPLQSAPRPSSVQILEAAPSGSVVSASPIGLAKDGSAEPDASRTAPNAAAAVDSASTRAPGAYTIGYALNTRADIRPESSAYKPK
jgi:hypothetical protein